MNKLPKLSKTNFTFALRNEILFDCTVLQDYYTNGFKAFEIKLICYFTIFSILFFKMISGNYFRTKRKSFSLPKIVLHLNHQSEQHLSRYLIIFCVGLTLFIECQIDGEDFVNFCGLLRKCELYDFSKEWFELGMSKEEKNIMKNPVSLLTLAVKFRT